MTPPHALPADDDPGLPIKFGPCSNGEYVPAPLSAIEREAIKRARSACSDNARRVGMSRPDFLRSVCGAATTLLSLQAVWLDAAKHLGGFWDVPAEGALDPYAARSTLAGNGPLKANLDEMERNARAAGKACCCMRRCCPTTPTTRSCAREQDEGR